MKALCWHGKQDIRCDSVPDPKIEHPRDAIIKVTSCAICGSDLHLYDGFMPGMEIGRHHGPRIHGRGGRGRRRKQKAQNRRPGGRAVHDHLRRMRPVPARQFLGMRAHQPQQGGRRQAVRPHHRRAVRLYAPDRRLSWRPGRIRPRALCRCGSGQDPEWPQRTSRSCFWAIFSRPAGRRRSSATSSPPTRWRSGAPARSVSSRSAARSCSAPSRSSAIDRLPERLGMASAGGATTINFAAGERRRASERADRRQRPGEMHRRGRSRSACDRDHRFDVRPGEAGADAGDRPAARAARDDVCLPPGRARSRCPGSMAGSSTRSRSARS